MGMHTLIIGRNGLPRRAVMEKIFAGLPKGLRICGFHTLKEAADGEGRAPIRICPLGTVRGAGDDLLGWCRSRKCQALPGVFERWLPVLREKGDLMVMDEIGSMESVAPAFMEEILRLLDGDMPVLAYVRDQDTPFLRRVRAHERALGFELEKLGPEKTAELALESVRHALEVRK